MKPAPGRILLCVKESEQCEMRSAMLGASIANTSQLPHRFFDRARKNLSTKRTAWLPSGSAPESEVSHAQLRRDISARSNQEMMSGGMGSTMILRSNNFAAGMSHFGSLADTAASNRDVRFSPERGHRSA